MQTDRGRNAPAGVPLHVLSRGRMAYGGSGARRASAKKHLA